MKGSATMKEKRKSERLDDFKEITITIISGEKNLPEGEKLINYSEDISVSGAKVRANILLPVDTLLQIDFELDHSALLAGRLP
jgi:hypothetical protein